MIELTQLFGLLVTVVPVLKDVLAILLMILPRTVADLLLWQFVWLPLALAVAYPVVIQYERGGWWKLLTPFTLLAAIVDVWLNFTTFSVYLWSTPERKELTLSQRLERLVFDAGWRGLLARAIARYTNWTDPTPPHIPLP